MMMTLHEQQVVIEEINRNTTYVGRIEEILERVQYQKSKMLYHMLKGYKHQIIDNITALQNASTDELNALHLLNEYLDQAKQATSEQEYVK